MRDDCCIRLGLNFFTKRHATTVIYRLIAKFHYTDPRGPDRTRISEKLRWSMRVSDNTIQYNTKFVKRHVAVASEALANRSVKKQRRRRTNVL